MAKNSHKPIIFQADTCLTVYNNRQRGRGGVGGGGVALDPHVVSNIDLNSSAKKNYLRRQFFSSYCMNTRVARFLLVLDTKTGKKCTK
jgi:hypothetical protein